MFAQYGKTGRWQIYISTINKGTTMIQQQLFNQKPILEVLKPIRFEEKNAPSNPQKTKKNEKS